MRPPLAYVNYTNPAPDEEVLCPRTSNRIEASLTVSLLLGKPTMARPSLPSRRRRLPRGYPFGQRAEGRAAVAAMYSEYFAGMLRGSLTSFNLDSARAVEADHAFADGEQTINAPDGTSSSSFISPR